MHTYIYVCVFVCAFEFGRGNLTLSPRSSFLASSSYFSSSSCLCFYPCCVCVLCCVVLPRVHRGLENLLSRVFSVEFDVVYLLVSMYIIVLLLYCLFVRVAVADIAAACLFLYLICICSIFQDIYIDK